MFGNGNLGNKSKTWSYFRYNPIPDMSPLLLACTQIEDSFCLPLCSLSHPSITGVIKRALTNGIVLNGHPRPPPPWWNTFVYPIPPLQAKKTFSQLASCVTRWHILFFVGLNYHKGGQGEPGLAPTRPPRFVLVTAGRLPLSLSLSPSSTPQAGVWPAQAIISPSRGESALLCLRRLRYQQGHR